ncbi:hypothetical protein RRG08_008549 [Elysia crispata]|uniref:Uncharacterized protein n=1 Tax=Elysia crispata TaxID=231223 RepID=A0AAE1D192_9GAST|nr:hypothetical protein RRG08_008549 [Elysia crispata]
MTRSGQDVKPENVPALSVMKYRTCTLSSRLCFIFRLTRSQLCRNRSETETVTRGYQRLRWTWPARLPATPSPSPLRVTHIGHSGYQHCIQSSSPDLACQITCYTESLTTQGNIYRSLWLSTLYTIFVTGPGLPDYLLHRVPHHSGTWPARLPATPSPSPLRVTYIGHSGYQHCIQSSSQDLACQITCYTESLTTQGNIYRSLWLSTLYTIFVTGPGLPDYPLHRVPHHSGTWPARLPATQSPSPLRVTYIGHSGYQHCIQSSSQDLACQITCYTVSLATQGDTYRSLWLSTMYTIFVTGPGLPDYLLHRVPHHSGTWPARLPATPSPSPLRVTYIDHSGYQQCIQSSSQDLACQITRYIESLTTQGDTYRSLWLSTLYTTCFTGPGLPNYPLHLVPHHTG